MLNTSSPKSGLPPISAISGVTKLATKPVTTAPNAAPTTTATARSTTLPRRMKSRNSLSTPLLLARGYPRPFDGLRGDPALLRRGPQGLAQPLRVGRAAAGDQARPLPVLLRRLSDRLRLHPRDADGEGLGARRDGLRVRAHVPRDRHPRE